MRWLLALALVIIFGLRSAPTVTAQPTTIVVDAPASIPSAAMIAGACPDMTVVDDATAALNSWLNSEYARIRLSNPDDTILFQFPADTCYRLDGSNAGGFVIEGKQNIIVQGDSYVVTDSTGAPLPSNNDDVLGIVPAPLPNRDDNGNPYPQIKVTTVFRIIRNLTLAEIKPTCTAWSVQGNCYSLRRHVFVKGGSDVTMRSLRVEGENLRWDQQKDADPNDDDDYGSYFSPWEFEHAFTVNGGTNMVFENLQARGIWGDGFYSQGNTNGLTLRNFRVSYNGRQGVALSETQNAVLENVQILNTRRAGFDLEPNSAWKVENVLIKNSYTKGYHTAFASGGIGEVNNITIQNNKISGQGGIISVGSGRQIRRYNWKFIDNEVLNTVNMGGGFRFTNVTNIEISRNIRRITAAQSRDMLTLTGVEGTVIIKDNDFGMACQAYKGDISGVTNLIVEGNIMSSAADCAGLITPMPTPTPTQTLVPPATPTPTITPTPTPTLSPLADTVRDALNEYPSVRQELVDAGVIE